MHLDSIGVNWNFVPIIWAPNWWILPCHKIMIQQSHFCHFLVARHWDVIVKYIVAAANPQTGWTRGPTLTAHTSPLPPPDMGSRVGQPAFQSCGRSNRPALTIYLPCIYRLITPIKPVYSEPLSVTVPVVIGTCTVLVGTVAPHLSFFTIFHL